MLKWNVYYVITGNFDSLAIGYFLLIEKMDLLKFIMKYSWTGIAWYFRLTFFNTFSKHVGSSSNLAFQFKRINDITSSPKICETTTSMFLLYGMWHHCVETTFLQCSIIQLIPQKVGYLGLANLILKKVRINYTSQAIILSNSDSLWMQRFFLSNTKIFQIPQFY